MGTKSRESIYGSSIRASAERVKEARKEADQLACVAWNQRMLGFKGPAQPSPALGDALNAGFLPLRFDALAATRTRPSPSTLYVARRRRPSMNSSGTCAARIAHRCAAISTSAATLLRSGQPRFQPATHRQRGGRENVDPS